MHLVVHTYSILQSSILLVTVRRHPVQFLQNFVELNLEDSQLSKHSSVVIMSAHGDLVHSPLANSMQMNLRLLIELISNI